MDFRSRTYEIIFFTSDSNPLPQTPVFRCTILFNKYITNIFNYPAVHSWHHTVRLRQQINYYNSTSFPKPQSGDQNKRPSGSTKFTWAIFCTTKKEQRTHAGTDSLWYLLWKDKTDCALPFISMLISRYTLHSHQPASSQSPILER